MKVVLIGIQGSGKSTQGNLLSEKLGVPYLSTGHIFRELSHERTPLGRYVKETMTAGYLIPDRKTLGIVKEYLGRPEYEGGYMLDGFPRTIAQAQNFKNGIDKAIYLKVSDEEALRRLMLRNGGREDEAPPALRKRIELFHKFTEPVLDYYRDKKILSEINGEQSVIRVFEDICRVLV